MLELDYAPSIRDKPASLGNIRITATDKKARSKESVPRHPSHSSQSVGPLAVMKGHRDSNNQSSSNGVRDTYHVDESPVSARGVISTTALSKELTTSLTVKTPDIGSTQSYEHDTNKDTGHVHQTSRDKRSKKEKKNSSHCRVQHKGTTTKAPCDQSSPNKGNDSQNSQDFSRLAASLSGDSGDHSIAKRINSNEDRNESKVVGDVVLWSPQSPSTRRKYKTENGRDPETSDRKRSSTITREHELTRENRHEHSSPSRSSRHKNSRDLRTLAVSTSGDTGDDNITRRISGDDKDGPRCKAVKNSGKIPKSPSSARTHKSEHFKALDDTNKKNTSARKRLSATDGEHEQSNEYSNDHSSSPTTNGSNIHKNAQALNMLPASVLKDSGGTSTGKRINVNEDGSRCKVVNKSGKAPKSPSSTRKHKSEQSKALDENNKKNASDRTRLSTTDREKEISKEYSHGNSSSPTTSRSNIHKNAQELNMLTVTTSGDSSDDSIAKRINFTKDGKESKVVGDVARVPASPSTPRKHQTETARGRETSDRKRSSTTTKEHELTRENRSEQSSPSNSSRHKNSQTLAVSTSSYAGEDSVEKRINTKHKDGPRCKAVNNSGKAPKSPTTRTHKTEEHSHASNKKNTSARNKVSPTNREHEVVNKHSQTTTDNDEDKENSHKISVDKGACQHRTQQRDRLEEFARLRTSVVESTCDDYVECAASSKESNVAEPYKEPLESCRENRQASSSKDKVTSPKPKRQDQRKHHHRKHPKKGKQQSSTTRSRTDTKPVEDNVTEPDHVSAEKDMNPLKHSDQIQRPPLPSDVESFHHNNAHKGDNTKDLEGSHHLDVDDQTVEQATFDAECLNKTPHDDMYNKVCVQESGVDSSSLPPSRDKRANPRTSRSGHLSDKESFPICTKPDEEINNNDVSQQMSGTGKEKNHDTRPDLHINSALTYPDSGKESVGEPSITESIKSRSMGMMQKILTIPRSMRRWSQKQKSRRLMLRASKSLSYRSTTLLSLRQCDDDDFFLDEEYSDNPSRRSLMERARSESIVGGGGAGEDPWFYNATAPTNHDSISSSMEMIFFFTENDNEKPIEE